jgi:hypothetical protein
MQSVTYPSPQRRKPLPPTFADDPLAFWRQQPRALHERIEVLMVQIGLGKPASEPVCVITGINASWDALHEEEMRLLEELRSLRGIREALRREREEAMAMRPTRRPPPPSARKPLPPPSMPSPRVVERPPPPAVAAPTPPQPAAVRPLPLSQVPRRRPVPSLPPLPETLAMEGVPGARDRAAVQVNDCRENALAM